MTKRTPNKTRPRTGAKKKSAATSAQTSDAARRPSGKLGLIVARLERTAGATIDELVRCDGLAETFGPRRSEPAPVGGLRHSSGIDGGTEGLSACTGRGVSHVSYGNPHYGKPDARSRRAR